MRRSQRSGHVGFPGARDPADSRTTVVPRVGLGPGPPGAGPPPGGSDVEDVDTVMRATALTTIPAPPAVPMADKPVLGFVVGTVILVVTILIFAWIQKKMMARDLNSYIDSCYQGWVLMTTVGYGDMVTPGLLNSPQRMTVLGIMIWVVVLVAAYGFSWMVIFLEKYLLVTNVVSVFTEEVVSGRDDVWPIYRRFPT